MVSAGDGAVHPDCGGDRRHMAATCRGAGSPRSVSLRPAAAIVAAVAAALIVVVAYRWTRILAWQSYQADMLIVIREATRRFLSGRTPYATYRTYDAPWNIAMPYGPGLWGPFLVAQFLRLDFRFLTIAGELFVPLWCGVAAVVEWLRGNVSQRRLVAPDSGGARLDVRCSGLHADRPHAGVLAAPSTVRRCGRTLEDGRRPHVFSGFSSSPVRRWSRSFQCCCWRCGTTTGRGFRSSWLC